MNSVDINDDGVKICAICGNEIEYDYIEYDGDPCHLKCALEFEDSIGMDRDFGARD